MVNKSEFRSRMVGVRFLASICILIVASGMARSQDQTAFDLSPLPAASRSTKPWHSKFLVPEHEPNDSTLDVYAGKSNLVFATDHEIVDLDPRSGAIRWRLKIANVYQEPIFAETPWALFVYTQSSKNEPGKILVLSPKTGRIENQVPFSLYFNPYVGPEGALFLGAYGKAILISNPQTIKTISGSGDSTKSALLDQVPSLRGRLVSVGALALENGRLVPQPPELGGVVVVNVIGNQCFAYHWNDSFIDTAEQVRGKVGVSRVKVTGLKTDSPQTTGDLWHDLLCPSGFMGSSARFAKYCTRNLLFINDKTCYAIDGPTGNLVSFPLNEPLNHNHVIATPKWTPSKVFTFESYYEGFGWNISRYVVGGSLLFEDQGLLKAMSLATSNIRTITGSIEGFRATSKGAVFWKLKKTPNGDFLLVDFVPIH